MRLQGLLSLGLMATIASAVPHRILERRATKSCDRACMTDIVWQLLESLESHDPFSLPLAKVYKATENSHPAALSMMTLWRTVTKAGPPSLLAIDTNQGTLYFSAGISEGGIENVFRARLAVVNQEITELELFVNRGRGDHGFSFSETELYPNDATLMNPPSNRTKASRADLTSLSEALFSESSDFDVTVSDTCVFSEVGALVVDTGTWANGTTDPVGCVWPDEHPTDSKARVGLVIDEELGFVITSGLVPGTVYPYQNVSAFIPNKMTTAQEAQDVWFAWAQKNSNLSLPEPFEATGDTLEVLQYYNNKLQGMQINVFLSGPNMTSLWL